MVGSQKGVRSRPCWRRSRQGDPGRYRLLQPGPHQHGQLAEVALARLASDRLRCDQVTLLAADDLFYLRVVQSVARQRAGVAGP